MIYRVIFADAAARALASLDADDRRAVYASLNDLRRNPQPQHGNVGRLHVGWLRITYEIAAEPSEEGTTTVTVWKIGTVA